VVRLTRHAAEALLARGVLPEWVEPTLAKPDWTKLDPQITSLARALPS
jgi:hypothetical protein